MLVAGPGPDFPAGGGPGRLGTLIGGPGQKGQNARAVAGADFGGKLQPAAGGGVQIRGIGDDRADGRATEGLGQGPETFPGGEGVEEEAAGKGDF